MNNNFKDYFLGNSYDKKRIFGVGFTDFLVISEELNLVNELCRFISEKINSKVYWYVENDKAIVCVKNGYIIFALDAAIPYIIKNFDTMSAKYIDRVRSSILERYETIGTFETEDKDGLKRWCENFDIKHELLVKINSEGQYCILTTDPHKFLPLIKTEHLKNPFDHLLSFS